MKYKNLPDLFFKKSERYQENVLIRYRSRPSAPLIDQTWKDIQTKIQEIALGLKKLGVKKGDNVGLLAITCHHWLPCDFGILTLGAVTVPLYHNSNTETVSYILEHAEIEVIIVHNKIQLQKIRSIWKSFPNLRYAIVMQDQGDIPSNDPKILTLDELQKIGREELARTGFGVEGFVNNIDLDDTASIIYTSGTTGVPKGVVLSHRNFLVAALSFYQYVPLEEGFRMLSFLPLAHIFERVASELYGIDQGVIFSYCERVEYLPKMLYDSQANMLPVVPRILEKIHAKILLEASKKGPLAEKIFQSAMQTGIEYAKKKLKREKISWDLELKYNLAYNSVLGKIKAKLAPNLKIFVVGGAPFSADISYFFFALGFNVIEGYGLTETSAPVTVNPPWANKPGTVGLPFQHFDVKIEEDGEIVVRGDSVFKGYYKDPQATAEVLIDGWFHTGDLGSFDEDGYLRITGRKKDIIITAGGKNISPTKVEHEILKSKYIAQAVVLGDQEKYLAALIVLNEPEVEEYLKSKNIYFDKNTNLYEMPEVFNLIDEQIAINNRSLDRYEQVKNFHILDHELTIDSGELTPTLKVKRNVIRARYPHIIKPLFNKPKPETELEETTSQ